MPNAGDSSMLKYPSDPGIYVKKPRQSLAIKKERTLRMEGSLCSISFFILL
jgi:hypothetical protein